MTCTFFGHRDAPGSIESALKETIEELIKRGVDKFYVGNNGNFDSMVRRVLKNIKGEHPQVYYAVVLSALPVSRVNEDTSDTVFPEGMEKTPPRFAITKRNKWMLEQSDIVVAYVRAVGGAEKFVNIAAKKGKEIINLAELL